MNIKFEFILNLILTTFVEFVCFVCSGWEILYFSGQEERGIRTRKISEGMPVLLGRIYFSLTDIGECFVLTDIGGFVEA